MSDVDSIALITLLIVLVLLFAIPLWLFVKAWNKVNRYLLAFIMLFTFSPLIVAIPYASEPGGADVVMFLPLTVLIGIIAIVLAPVFFKKTPTNVSSTSPIKAPVKGGRRV